MALSNYFEDKLTKHMLGTAYTAPTNLYLALFTTNPADDASGTEATGASYARIDLTTEGLTDNGDGTFTNTGTISVGPTTESWGTITHFAIFDASTAGNMLWYNAVTASKTIGSGDTFSIAAGGLVIGFD